MRFKRVALAVALACGCGAVLAQSGALARVTMRVLDDLAGRDVVIIELPPP